MNQNETDISAKTPEQLQIVESPRPLEAGDLSLSEHLTQRQLSVLPYLLRPGTLTSKAKAAGIGRTTLYRWLEDDNFRASLQLLRQATFEVAQTELQAMSFEAAEVLRNALHSGDEALNLKAAKTILDQSQYAQHSFQVRKRLDTLDEAVALRKHTASPW